MTVSFWSPGSIPLDAFTMMGANVKLNDNPIGQFGTGLKYAVAVILRHGGTVRLFVRGEEYEFYTHNKEFRGKELETVRMRKRHGTLSKWLSSKQLPFTLNYGRNWELWQAYRELESNTRDERGATFTTDSEHCEVPDGGTLIQVDCPGFSDAVEESEAFLPPDRKLLYSGPMVDIYDGESKYFYYRGIRVYDLRYPAKLTYDWKHPYVQLTEDRTAGNSWSMIYSLSQLFQTKLEDTEILRKALMTDSEDEAPSFEASEFMFDGDGDGSKAFMSLMYSAGGGSVSWGKSLRSYRASYEARIEKEPSTGVEMPDAQWNELLGLLKAVSDQRDLEDDDAYVAAQLFAIIEKELQ